MLGASVNNGADYCEQPALVQRVLLSLKFSKISDHRPLLIPLVFLIPPETHFLKKVTQVRLPSLMTTGGQNFLIEKVKNNFLNHLAVLSTPCQTSGYLGYLQVID